MLLLDEKLRLQTEEPESGTTCWHLLAQRVKRYIKATFQDMLISNKTEAQLCRVSAVHRHIHQVISILYILLPLIQDQSLTEHPTTSTRLLITQSIALQTNKSHIKTISNQYKKKRHLDLLHLAEVRYRTCHGFWLFLKFRIPRIPIPGKQQSLSEQRNRCLLNTQQPPQGFEPTILWRAWSSYHSREPAPHFESPNSSRNSLGFLQTHIKN